MIRCKGDANATLNIKDSAAMLMTVKSLQASAATLIKLENTTGIHM